MIEFAGGLNLDTSGPIRVEEREKQWYVIGEGLLLPADSEEDAQGVLNSIVTQGIYMNMKVFKSPGARARVKAVLDAEGLDMQGADAVSFSSFAHHSEAPKAVADEFVELEKAGLRARAGLSAAKRASEQKGSSR